MRIKKVGVVGAGTMGSGIAALLASAGVPVVLLDIPGKDDPLEFVKRGLERAKKARPAAFMRKDRAALITIGNTRDDLELLGDVDWVIEAIIEKLEPKQELYARLEEVLPEHAIVSSNTSGIPMKALLEGRSDRFKKRFLGTHFFNPPRYLHLLEIIPTPHTDPAVLEAIENFGDRILGKGLVRAKDVPGFIANRLGVYGMLRAVALMEKHDLTIDEVDALTGPLIGRPKSAVFRTADLTGLDVLKMVAEELAHTTGEDFSLPDWVLKVIEGGCLGDKTKCGFYKKEGKEIYTLDWKTLEYRPRQKPKIPGVDEAKQLSLPKRIAAVLDLPGKYGAFLRDLFAVSSQYTLAKTPEIAYDVVSVDRALKWGFGWRMGPFEQMDAVGLDKTAELIEAAGLEKPELLAKAEGSFYKKEGASRQMLALEGGYVPVPELPGVIEIQTLKDAGKVVKESKDAGLYDLGDGVLLLEFRTKMGALGEGIFKMLDYGMKYIEQNDLAGLVIGREDERAFSAGANLALILMLAQEGEWDELEMAVKLFQKSTMRLREAPFPVVVAPFGLTLGGGAEMTLHADRVQAAAESYIGLVEVGVGLIPAGGGTKELLFRFTEDLAPYTGAMGAEADPFAAVKRAFEVIAMAKTSTSALEAFEIGYLQKGDRISMNKDRLIADAKQRVLDLAPDYVSPVRGKITALGKEALGNLKYAVWSFREAGQITDHEVRIASELAYVLSGGDGPRREVSEWDILDLEREAFLKLLGTRKTQERIAHTLKTGKTLRN
ncbi:3-hydroxyacyl-CoA dehydrogenase [Oceanithermus profundus DSM 14977]|uniref:3-hydroxyacyl-CoA dehydrogenase n=1 Tax=Oceanithermus profundus (strain DSM 14977 / NBRC 100410 / VKM B-2274 / 506) TaxID=670487 RepID=E4U7E1_OCEP5|nr:3-hydroxyacyl-CoA dehydrogenase/enoyl-CoA hydratase family protein [Oceanithermus profundus]ADR36390.1 3-hydroxyacyl-CoA dehydrogenase [Oceanithermus profundus DSM 14977]